MNKIIKVAGRNILAVALYMVAMNLIDKPFLISITIGFLFIVGSYIQLGGIRK